MGTVRHALRPPDIRRIELGYGWSVTGELTASNAVTAVMENSGALIGPLAAGVLLLVAAPPAAIGLAAGFLGAATASLARLAVPDIPALAGGGAVYAIRDVTGGLAEFARLAPPGGVAILIFGQTFVRGALVVLIPVLAVHVLALGESAVGWLNAAFGVGGLIDGAVAAAAVRITTLGRSFVTGRCCGACPCCCSVSGRPRLPPIWLWS